MIALLQLACIECCIGVVVPRQHRGNIETSPGEGVDGDEDDELPQVLDPNDSDAALSVKMNSGLGIAHSTLEVIISAWTDATRGGSNASGFWAMSYQTPEDYGAILAPNFRFVDSVDPSAHFTYRSPYNYDWGGQGVTWAQLVEEMSFYPPSTFSLYESPIMREYMESGPMGREWMQVDDTFAWSSGTTLSYAVFRVDFVNIDGVWKIEWQETLEYKGSEKQSRPLKRRGKARSGTIATHHPGFPYARLVHIIRRLMTQTCS